MVFFFILIQILIEHSVSMIRRWFLLHLIWVCNVCICPIKRDALLIIFKLHCKEDAILISLNYAIIIVA